MKRVRGSPARHGNDKSLGLGLYIARGRGHGGEIEGHSDKFGTVFSVRLPRQNFRPAEAIHEVIAAAVAHRASVALP